ncbi:MAG: cbb3-type cytochrome c oxidase N-terminal domain-containing protein [Bdellovibrionales bacterium]
MSEDKDNPINGHDYDGIQELDNPLPNWWLTTFLITIMFSFFYWIHYEFSGGVNQWQELKQDMAHIEVLKKKRPATGDSDQDLEKLLASASVVDEGGIVYAAKCASCHGPQLQGLIGPNLTDEFWIHGHGKLSEIVGVIRKGVLDKGMPPWDGQLKDNEIKAVAVYIAKQKGTNPPNPKAPQGEKIVSN